MPPPPPLVQTARDSGAPLGRWWRDESRLPRLVIIRVVGWTGARADSRARASLFTLNNWPRAGAPNFNAGPRGTNRVSSEKRQPAEESRDFPKGRRPGGGAAAARPGAGSSRKGNEQQARACARAGAVTFWHLWGIVSVPMREVSRPFAGALVGDELSGPAAAREPRAKHVLD